MDTRFLSVSEMIALAHLDEALEDGQGILVASKVADNAGITRSVIVNAASKMKAAGIIEGRSLGMKGSYFRILDQQRWSKVITEARGYARAGA